MLGRQHLTLSFFSGIIVFSPLIHVESSYFILSVIGVCIGSLIPDVDAEDASIFHSKVRGLKGDTGLILNDFIAPLLPLFGYVTKYIIYRPLLVVYDKFLFSDYEFSDSHRDFTHSILGVFSITVFTGVLIGIPLHLIKEFNFVFLYVFLVGYLVGCLLHMLQDSCTRTGIAWNSPFSGRKLKGEIYTGKDFFKIHIFSLILGVTSSLFLFVSFTGQFGFSFFRLSVFCISTLLALWMMFLWRVNAEIVD